MIGKVSNFMKRKTKKKTTKEKRKFVRAIVKEILDRDAKKAEDRLRIHNYRGKCKCGGKLSYNQYNLYYCLKCGQDYYLDREDNKIHIFNLQKLEQETAKANLNKRLNVR